MAVQRRRDDDMVGFVKVSTLNNERDKKILDLLLKNSRTTTTDIASVLKISDVATRRRIKKLEDDNVIVGYTIIVNPRKLGFQIAMHLSISIDPKKKRYVIEKLKEIENVINIIPAVNTNTIIADIWAINVEDASRIIELISDIDGVKNVQATLLGTPVKLNGIDIEDKLKR